jgi:hypothetical protein
MIVVGVRIAARPASGSRRLRGPLCIQSPEREGLLPLAASNPRPLRRTTDRGGGYRARVAKRISADVERELAQFTADLLRGRPEPLGPDQGAQAFQQHKLLATAVHRAAKLDQKASESQTEAWVRYVSSHFPKGRNDAETARLLFTDWRTSLLKEDTPGPGVALAHGEQGRPLHWQRDRGRLGINLEDAWDDFAASVESFVAYLRSSPRRKAVLGRWRRQRWQVEPFVVESDLPSDGFLPIVSASVSASATSIVATGDGQRLPVSGAISATASAPIPPRPSDR